MMNTIKYEKEFSGKQMIKFTEISDASQGFNRLFFSSLTTTDDKGQHIQTGFVRMII